MLSNADNRYMQILLANCRYMGPVFKVRIYSMLVLNSRDNTGPRSNSKKSSPFQKKYATDEHGIYIHAEIDSIREAVRRKWNLSDFAKSTLYIARMKLDNFGNFENAMAKPCLGCQRAITAFEIGRIIYTTDGSGYEVLNKWK